LVTYRSKRFNIADLLVMKLTQTCVTLEVWLLKSLVKWASIKSDKQRAMEGKNKSLPRRQKQSHIEWL